MPKLFIAFLYSLTLALLSCHSSKIITGTYRSKFAVHGMFGTTIRLKPDSTLEYIFQGDLMYDSATGRYQQRGDKLYLNFDKEVQDSNRLYYRFDNMPLKRDVYLGDTIFYKQYFYIGKNRLYPAHYETGKKVTKARGYSKKKKYLLFGSHYYDRKYYYKRVN
jgi:hypothetical protein